MQVNVETARPTQDRDSNEDQYRRPSCSPRPAVKPTTEKPGPNTASLLHLLDEMGL